jgi:hypothetical protein
MIDDDDGKCNAYKQTLGFACSSIDIQLWIANIKLKIKTKAVTKQKE